MGALHPPSFLKLRGCKHPPSFLKLRGRKHPPSFLKFLKLRGRKHPPSFLKLKPVRDAFLRSADVLLGHSAAVLAGEPGYAAAETSDRFDTAEEKNARFAERGRAWREEVFGTA